MRFGLLGGWGLGSDGDVISGKNDGKDNTTCALHENIYTKFFYKWDSSVHRDCERAAIVIGRI